MPRFIRKSTMTQADVRKIEELDRLLKARTHVRKALKDNAEAVAINISGVFVNIDLMLRLNAHRHNAIMLWQSINNCIAML